VKAIVIAMKPARAWRWHGFWPTMLATLVAVGACVAVAYPLRHHAWFADKVGIVGFLIAVNVTQRQIARHFSRRRITLTGDDIRIRDLTYAPSHARDAVLVVPRDAILAIEPLAGEPVAGELPAAEPLAGGLLAGEPLTGERLTVEPLAIEPLAIEPLAVGVLAGEPVEDSSGRPQSEGSAPTEGRRLERDARARQFDQDREKVWQERQSRRPTANVRITVRDGHEVYLKRRSSRRPRSSRPQPWWWTFDSGRDVVPPSEILVDVADPATAVGLMRLWLAAARP
jgi:hypothetical protein